MIKFEPYVFTLSNQVWGNMWVMP